MVVAEVVGGVEAEVAVVAVAKIRCGNGEYNPSNFI